MLQTFKNGQGSIVLRVKLLDSTATTGAGLTGLTSASSGLIISTIADNEASATAYTVAGSTIEAVTTLGTYAAPTATKCRFKEVDATNHKGIYEIQIADARFAVSSAKSLLVSLSGATNLAQADFVVQLQTDDPYVAKPSNYASLVIDGSGRVDVSKIGGTSQTARDIGASVLLSSGTGTGQLSLSSGLVTLAASQPGVTIPTVTTVTNQLTAAAIATGVWQDTTAGDFTTALSVGKSIMNGVSLGTGLTVASVSGAVGSVSGAVGSVTGNVGGSVASVTAAVSVTGDLSATMKTSVTTAATAATPAAASVTGAVGSVTGNVGGNVTGSVGSISGITFPTRFSSLAIDVSGNVTFGNTSIATVTNLTNAPTTGDFNATMKTSLNAATPVATLSGDFSATMKTSLNAATPAVTVSDKTGFALTSAYDAAKTAASATAVAALPTTSTVMSADVKKVNGVTVNGDGAGTPWGP